MRTGAKLGGLAVALAAGLAVSGAVAVGGRSAPQASNAAPTAVVTRVIDGDTLVARLHGKTERVRLIGIDSPELGTCFATEAKAAAGVRASGRSIRLVADASQGRRDRYGRLLAYVTLPGGVDLARSLIAGGFGRVYVYDAPFARVGAYRAAEAAARMDRLGVWSRCGSPPAAGATTTVAVPVAPPATTEVAPPGRCDAAYPSVCIPAPPPDLDCGEISFHAFKVLAPDPHRFDGDDDGLGCE